MSASPAALKLDAGAAPGSLRLSGALDFDTAAAAFAQSASWLKPETRELDLAGITRADSAALALVVAWAVQARQHGTLLRYRHAPAGLLALAKSCDLDRLLDIRAD